MSNFINEKSSEVLHSLLNIYERVMVLKLFVDSEDNILKEKYNTYAVTHNNKLLNNSMHIDAGFDLFAPGNEGLEEECYGDDLRFFGPDWSDVSPTNKLDLKVCCSAKIFTDTGKNYNTGYYMYPRSSLSKTQLRLANSTGIIDAGYRGHLMGIFDVVNIPNDYPDDKDADYFGKKYERYLQICAPSLAPIVVEVVNSMDDLGEETTRGSGGFGSTGK
jgi:dUTPase